MSTFLRPFGEFNYPGGFNHPDFKRFKQSVDAFKRCWVLGVKFKRIIASNCWKLESFVLVTRPGWKDSSHNPAVKTYSKTVSIKFLLYKMRNQNHCCELSCQLLPSTTSKNLRKSAFPRMMFSTSLLMYFFSQELNIHSRKTNYMYHSMWVFVQDTTDRTSQFSSSNLQVFRKAQR